MKRFKFSLQTLHDLRTQEREDAELALAQSTALVAAAAERIVVVRDTIKQAVTAYAAQMNTKAPDPRAAEMHTQYIATLEARLVAAKQEHAELERQRERKRQELIKASAAAEATTKLREQYYARYVADLMREEQNLVDELATIANVRRLRGVS
ncbi:MAG TPA: flagellar export protein FliJ [Blastocatellia bacterium]|nr:flagellar export protein FliJ [Blastocatellia bacterium]